jgi:hypothetical protein
MQPAVKRDSPKLSCCSTCQYCLNVFLETGAKPIQITNITLFFKDIMFIYKKRGYETISPFSEETNYALFSLILAFLPVSLRK